jgi:flagellar biosynthesis component FlhA
MFSWATIASRFISRSFYGDQYQALLRLRCFPTVHLLTTLLRLSLNVASTRVVLMDGHEGTVANRRLGIAVYF